MNVIKRDGRIVSFGQNKIENAVQKAVNELKEPTPNGFAATIADKVTGLVQEAKKDCSVEEIQDYVEKALMAAGAYDIAKSYIKFRYKKEVAREQRDDFVEAIKEKLDGTNVKNQNANVDERAFGGRTGEASSVVTKKLALDWIISPMARKNHLNNEVYIHDLDSYYVGSHNCLSIPFDDLLANGFNTRQTDVRPAQSLSTAFQLVAVIFQLQSLQQFGGVSATHLDWTMVPYVRKSFYKHFKDGLRYIDGSNECVSPRFHDDLPIDAYQYIHHNGKAYKYAMNMTIKEARQAAEAMFHNLNTLQSRSGNQLPFTSINFGTCTSPEGRLVIKALLDASIKGVGKLHKTPIFPCSIFQCMNGVNRKPGDPNYDLFRLALKSTSLRLYPNYANVDWSGNAGYDHNDPRTYFSTMGQRKLQLM